MSSSSKSPADSRGVTAAADSRLEPLPADFEPYDFEPPDLEPYDFEPPDFEPPDFAPADFDPYDLEPAGFEPADFPLNPCPPAPLGRGLRLPPAGRSADTSVTPHKTVARPQAFGTRVHKAVEPP